MKRKIFAGSLLVLIFSWMGFMLVGVFFPTFIPTCTGVAANDTAAFTALVNYINAGSRPGTIKVPWTTTRCKVNDLTITSKITLDFASNSTGIEIVDGKTLTVEGPLLAADHQQLVYNALPGQGTLSFSGNNSINHLWPEIWGGIPGVSTATQMGAFQRAVDTGIPVQLANTGTGTSYQLDNSTKPLMLNNSTYSTATIQGAGQNATLVRFTSSAKPGIQIDFRYAGAPSAYLKDFYMRGAVPDASAVSGNYGIYEPGFHTVSISAASNTSTVSLTAVAHGIVTGTSVPISGGTGAWTAINGTFVATVTSADTFTIPVNSTAFGALAGAVVVGVNHKISNLVIENVQIDQFGDAGICVRGETGPVKIINPIINDVGNHGIVITADVNSPNTAPQDVTIDGGSIQGSQLTGCKGGIAAIGVDSAIISLTIRDTDVELRAGQTKPALHLEQVHGALISGVTLSTLANSLSTGDANIYLGPGVYGCTFLNLTNAVAGTAIHNVNAASSAVLNNQVIGGQYSNNPAGTGYLYTQTVGAENNWFSGITFSSSNFAALHSYAPMRKVEILSTPVTVATTGTTSTIVIVPADGFVTGVDFAGSDDLVQSNTNYVTLQVRNVPDPGGTRLLLTTAAANTTKATGGFAVAANVAHSLTINGTAGAWPMAAAMKVTKGDRLLTTFTVTGTLPNTVTFSQVQIYMIRTLPTGP